MLEAQLKLDEESTHEISITTVSVSARIEKLDAIADVLHESGSVIHHDNRGTIASINIRINPGNAGRDWGHAPTDGVL